MPDERAISAIGRIERALARVGAASNRLADRSAAADDSCADDLQALRTTHQVLRDKVEGAISQIDRLLDAREQG